MANQVVKRAQGLFNRRQRIVGVKLVQIDPVGVETAQAVFDGIHDVAPRSALQSAVIAHRKTELGGDHHILAARAERVSEKLFRRSPPVAIRRVEQSDAGIERLVHHTAALIAVDPGPEIVAAEPHQRDAETGLT